MRLKGWEKECDRRRRGRRERRCHRGHDVHLSSGRGGGGSEGVEILQGLIQGGMNLFVLLFGWSQSLCKWTNRWWRHAFQSIQLSNNQKVHPSHLWRYHSFLFPVSPSRSSMVRSSLVNERSANSALLSACTQEVNRKSAGNKQEVSR